jgi:hypothetical protein
MRKVFFASVGLVLLATIGAPCRVAARDATAPPADRQWLASYDDSAAAKPAAKPYDPECPRCPKHPRPKFGGGGGFTPGYIFADLGAVNKQVKRMGIPELDEAIFAVGGKGYGRFGNVIIGGGGYSGSTETSGMPDESARFARVELGYGGGLVGVNVGCSRYDLTAGLLVGGGGITVTRRIAAQGVFDWQDAWDTFGENLPDSVASGDLTVSSRITADFMAIEPFVEMKIWLTRFMALDLSGSYLRAHVARGTWKMDGLEILNSPEANLGGPSVKLGLIFGS